MISNILKEKEVTTSGNLPEFAAGKVKQTLTQNISDYSRSLVRGPNPETAENKAKVLPNRQRSWVNHT
jgi:hypothetical protein